MAAIWSGFVVALETVLLFFYDPTKVGIKINLPFHSAGLAIILFTILIKVVLIPLTVSQMRSSREMQKIQPKVRELQKKYSKDREKLNQEMMKLYREHGVNPTAGCLPSLLQIPIFFGVYYAVLNLTRVPSLGSLLGRWAGLFLGLGAQPTAEQFAAGITKGALASQPFLWMANMGKPDPWHILPILAGVLQLIQQRMMTQKDGDPQQSAMNNAMMFMPLMIVFIGWNFAAGPVIYWVMQSLISVVQQYYTTGWGALRAWLPFLPERKVPQKEPKPRPKPVVAEGEPGTQRGWFWRMMDRAATLQEQQRKAREEGTAASEGDEAAGEEAPSLPPAPEKRRSRR